jgi:type II secretory pathway pseudopilin PulG
MVVLAIVAGVAALVAPRLPAATARAELPLIRVLHAQLATAVETGSPVHVFVRDNKELYSNSKKPVQKPAGAAAAPGWPVPDNPQSKIIYTLGPEESLNIEEPQPSYYTATHPGVSFYPNGQMTAARWIYSTGGQRFRLRFSPFSARITAEPAA